MAVFVLDPTITIFTITCIITGAVVIFKYFPFLIVDPPSPTSSLASSSLSPSLSNFSNLLRGSRLSILSSRSSNDSDAKITGTTASASSFSLEKAYASFNAYLQSAESEVQLYKSRFRNLRGAHKRFTIALEYPNKLDRLEQACSFNATITRGICVQAQSDFPHLSELGVMPTSNMLSTKGFARKDTDISRVRESLKHLVRDWSREGQRERDIIFTPILNELMKVPEVARPRHKVLIPGSGLGRLAWEIAGRGFDTTSCELSFYMNLSLRFLLSSLSTWTINQHKIQPFAHWWSHQRSNENTFRIISFPDELPRRLENWTILEDDFLTLSPPTTHSRSKSTHTPPQSLYTPQTSPTSSTLVPSSPSSSAPTSTFDSIPSTPRLIPNGYDTIVTLFFIDTASNIISYLQQIHYLLKPGGKWINLGPLLYSNASVELNLEEVLQLADMIGFNVHQSSRRQIPSEYTADKHAMMKWLYQAEFWVASKRTDDLFG